MFGIRANITKSVSAITDILKLQTRNTFVLKRKWPPPLHGKGGKPSKLRGRHFVYDLVQDTNIQKKPDIKIILSQYVDGVGTVGDVLSLRPTKAYKEFLMPGLAVYASPENLMKYQVDESKPKQDDTFSSPYVQRTMNCLSRLVLQISMSKHEPWTLEPWHIRTSFRKAGFVVPEHAIEMPPAQIKGPDPDLQEKEFYITVTINKREKVNVRCRVHHWATGLERLPWAEAHWKQPRDALFPEQAAVLDAMPLPQ
ncbi:39S ribosomal protein L9, mitochondrial [Plutella xylostella]|uniref:39S ribosomal protein L9, mitochondrial n=1 Tax=Plutella xylostella TaxID=51655 RepID=UPI002032DE82|nr:39S ribosomal protein L9, mitochondrial [Plutella xylostella]